MTLAELLEKSRDMPQNVGVNAVVVDGKRNRAGTTMEIADVFFDLDRADQIFILLKKSR
ncbi:MAG: hypothetical protein IJZ10_11585 [Thermoguttaceae bacterium]|nr:hypothetical protein [Thermoguttaceae bacterium]